MLDLIRELFPICRSIAGDGLRDTMRRIARRIPISIHEVPTGTQAFDWTVPQEWSLNRAMLRGPDGAMVADTNETNLHVVNYSHPFLGTLSFDQLQPHLHSMPDKPTWVPYRTSYYKPTWGFCLRDDVRRSLVPGEYEVDIDTTVRDGSLSYGELLIPGMCHEEMLFSVHCCHPSLANDNLSGIAVAVELARRLIERGRASKNTLSARFVFLPGTIGAITWLSRNAADMKRRTFGGLVLSCLGDRGPFTYKRSRRGTAAIDRIVASGLPASRVRDFIPYGYDERQYCSPGFDLPVGCLMRTPNGEYPEYHTSADDVALIDPKALEESVAMLEAVFEAMCVAVDEPSREPPARVQGEGLRYQSLNPHCEPQLGRRGLYAMMGGKASVPDLQMALLWVLNYSDGMHGVDWIATRAKIDRKTIDEVVALLTQASLLAPA
jgi:aminopeptidase-like protein